MSLPNFLIKRTPKLKHIREIRAQLSDHSLHTVCESASCPNIGECFSQGTCTFMIMGGTCSRSCAFCGIGHGEPTPLDPNEPSKVAAAAKKLNLDYVVITSVTRDDLPDGGAAHFVETILAVKADLPDAQIEVLIPDFQGDEKALHTVLLANPTVLNHNVETVPRLYRQIRPQAVYQRSLKLLKTAAEGGVYTKSGFMVGLGEEKGEITGILADLRHAGCDLITIGQYLPPSRRHLPAERYVTPEEFAEYKVIGEQMGFLRVDSGPFVRSSYHAKEALRSRLQ